VHLCFLKSLAVKSQRPTVLGNSANHILRSARRKLSFDFKGDFQFWGCLSTGVIDADTQRLYQVCWVSPDNTGNPQTARWGVQFLFNKFDPPVIDGGQIYVPNYNGGVDLYRLAQVDLYRLAQ
jgi:hypothetical protein